MPIIEFSLIIKCFKEGKKIQKDYLFPEEAYEGIIRIKEPEKFIDVKLKTLANGNKLPVRVFLNVDKEIFCVVRRKKGNIRFILQTESSAGKTINEFAVTGQTVPKSKFTNWSACMEVLRRS
ncbi:MAG: hypothetical protein Q7T79_01645 [bacterium]|nr:hypothetical protein [bacterium]